MTPQEVVELTEILHSELLLQRGDDTLKQLLTGSCEHNASHHIATRRTRHEVPRLVGKKSRVLFHRATPVRIRQGVADRGGYRRDPQLPRWRRESRPETPSAESPWDGHAKDPDG